MNEHNEKMERLFERTSTAMYALWSALLTSHTVMLSVGVTLTAIDNSPARWPLPGLVFSAAACMVALLFNFAATRMQYDTIGRRLAERDKELSETEKKRDIATALRRNKAIRVFEVIASGGLLLESFLLFSWVFVYR